ncbi:MAG: FKBP-type peptidyl-prolyl cis-trans isomerase N-terminal domain-containing protein [Syntrophales bacterium]
MKLKAMMALGILLVAVSAIAAEAEYEAFKTYEEKVSYGLGVDLARTLKRTGVSFDGDILLRGIRDELTGGKLLMSEKELRAIMSTHHGEMERKQEEARKAVAEENRQMGEAFLAENRTQEGVVSLASGLQYKILRQGSGRKPTEADTIECHYRGLLVNGTEFHSTYRSGQPATFKVQGLIPGWAEAVKLMPLGSKWQLFIPPELAYGERGSARHVGPNTTIVLELELLGIK